MEPDVARCWSLGGWRRKNDIQTRRPILLGCPRFAADLVRGVSTRHEQEMESRARLRYMLVDFHPLTASVGHLGLLFTFRVKFMPTRQIAHPDDQRADAVVCGFKGRGSHIFAFIGPHSRIHETAAAVLRFLSCVLLGYFECEHDSLTLDLTKLVSPEAECAVRDARARKECRAILRSVETPRKPPRETFII